MEKPKIDYSLFIFSEAFFKPVYGMQHQEKKFVGELLKAACETRKWFFEIEDIFINGDLNAFITQFQLKDTFSIYNREIIIGRNTIRALVDYYALFIAKWNPDETRARLANFDLTKNTVQKSGFNKQILDEVIEKTRKVKNMDFQFKYREFLRTLIIGLIQTTGNLFESLCRNSMSMLFPDVVMNQIH